MRVQQQTHVGPPGHVGLIPVMKSARQCETYVSPTADRVARLARHRPIDQRDEGRTEPDRNERVRQMSRFWWPQASKQPLDPVRRERDRNEHRERNARPSAFDEQRDRGVAGVHSARPPEESVERRPATPTARSARRRSRTCFTRATSAPPPALNTDAPGLLRFCAHSSQSVALACSVAPQLPHRLNTRTPCGVTSRWIDAM